MPEEDHLFSGTATDCEPSTSECSSRELGYIRHKVRARIAGRSTGPVRTLSSCLSMCIADQQDRQPCRARHQVQCVGECILALCMVAGWAQLACSVGCMQYLTCLCFMRVQVSDIKRANNLLSDTGMFAREFVLIPTQQLPVGCAHGRCWVACECMAACSATALPLPAARLCTMHGSPLHQAQHTHAPTSHTSCLAGRTHRCCLQGCSQGMGATRP